MNFRPRGRGYIPSPPDSRDCIIERPLSSGSLPREFSLREHVVSVLDQGSLSSCVANGVAQAVRMIHHGQGVSKPRLLSRLALYYLARAHHGGEKDDSGTYIRSAFAALRGYGFCNENWWPYYVEKVNKPLPWRALQMSGDQRKAEYGRIMATGEELVYSIKDRIRQGQPVVFGTDIGAAFANNDLGDVEYAPRAENVVGGHCMVATGWRADGAIEILNSWGSGWGRDGFCWFHPSYIGHPMTRDIWTVIQVPEYSEA